MKIETMRKEHVSAVAQIAATSIPDAWSEKLFECELENTPSTVFVAISDDKVVGFCGVQTVLDEAYITNIAVDKPFRRKGVGDTILKAIINDLKDFSFISLEVRVSNVAAINLYKKHGFVSQGIRKGFYSHPTEDANIMTLFLKD